jgi:hypothetical protein
MVSDTSETGRGGGLKCLGSERVEPSGTSPRPGRGARGAASMLSLAGVACTAANSPLRAVAVRESRSLLLLCQRPQAGNRKQWPVAGIAIQAVLVHRELDPGLRHYLCPPSLCSPSVRHGHPVSIETHADIVTERQAQGTGPVQSATLACGCPVHVSKTSSVQGFPADSMTRQINPRFLLPSRLWLLCPVSIVCPVTSKHATYESSAPAHRP